MSGIVHFHDQASVAKNLVLYGQRHNLPWSRVWRYPEYSRFTAFDYPYTVAAELIVRAASRTSNSFIHIHGGHLHQFAARTKSEYVLHLHGSEVRVFDQSGKMHSSVNSDVKRAIEGARLVIYSTPDLAQFVHEIRKDAIWLPNPLSDRTKNLMTNKFTISATPEFDIFWPHAWTNAKGYCKLIDLVSHAREKMGRKIRLLGIALGDHQKEALAAGFTLTPVASKRIFWQLNSRAVVTLGQGLGLIGVSDVECMSIARTFINFPLEPQTRVAYENASGWVGSLSEEETLEKVIEALKKEDDMVATRVDAIQIHSLENSGAVLERMYRDFEI